MNCVASDIFFAATAFYTLSENPKRQQQSKLKTKAPQCTAEPPKDKQHLIFILASVFFC